MKIAMPLALIASLAALFRPTPGISADVREFLSHVSMHDMSDGLGHTIRVARITGVNVQIVNGAGQTFSANGAGNLILGYSEFPAFGGPVYRNGSHNLVVGPGHNWNTANSGVVAGRENEISTDGSVAFGAFNSAGYASTVLGGTNNQAAGSSVILGGAYNKALSMDSHATVCGGFQNNANAPFSAISGGRGRFALGDYDWVAGSLWEDQ